MLLDLVIQIHNMEDVHKLTFIFMQTLHLHVKDRPWIYFNTVMLLDVCCQTLFILILNLHKFLKRLFVIRILLKSGH